MKHLEGDEATLFKCYIASILAYVKLLEDGDISVALSELHHVSRQTKKIAMCLLGEENIPPSWLYREYNS